MAKDISEVLEEYIPPGMGPGPQLCNISVKIDLEAKILLEAVAEHLGAKKTKLFVELAESAIHQAFDLVQDDMDPTMKQHFADRIMKEVEHVQR